MKTIVDLVREHIGAGDIKEAARIAKEDLESKGYIKLPAGSYWVWMHAEWFAKAVEANVIVENEYGQFIPVCRLSVTAEIVAKKGKEFIREEKKKLDFSEFQAFAEEYDKFLRQQYVVEEQMTGLLNA